MSVFDYKLSTITKYRSGTVGDPFLPVTESKKIINNAIQLSEIPVFFNKVTITGYVEVQRVLESGLGANQYIVDYNEGIIQFSSSAEGITIPCSYYGRGNHFVSSARIWTKESNGEVTQTLDEVVSAASEFTHKGSYNLATTYQAYNLVNYQGGTFMCILVSTGNVPTNTGFWKKVTGFQWRDIYSTLTTYNAGDTVINSAGDTIYQSLIDNNINQLLTDSAKWQTLVSVKNAIDLVNTTNTSVTKAESSRVTAESGRVTAETGRVSSETTRGTNETGRTTSESSRVSAESVRTSNETTRGTNETGRTTAESTRVTVEGNRVTAETARASAETTRASNESTRISSESTRVFNETSRSTAESTRVTNETNRGTAESGRVSAESGRVSAETTRSGNETTRLTNETARIGRDTAFQLIEVYNAGNAYVPLNKTTYGGSTYQCILNSTGNLPTNTIYWIQIAAKGLDGAGTVVGISSPNADIAVGGTASNPTVTLNSGTGANQIAKRDGSGSFNATTVTTNANLTGDVTSVGNATTLTNAPVIAKVLTGYTSGAGTISATDSILSAIQKLNGNDATNAQLTGATFTGQVSTAATTGVIGQVAGSLGKLEVKGNGNAGDAAYMMFHRPGAYASYFGLDIDNKWKVGGYSAGANSYELWHGGSFDPNTKLSTSSYTAADVLAKLLTVDGAGSGLDAGLFKGVDLLTQNQGTHTSSVGLSEALKWKNYGNGHTIFDASQGTSPTGSAVNATNSSSAWSSSYPTLMGWNGSSTYGVRVDSARVADSATTVGLTQFAATFGSAGYQKLPSGNIIQWGALTPSTTGTFTNYPIAFPSGISGVQITANSSTNTINATVSGASLTGFTAYASTSVSCYWVAIGF